MPVLSANGRLILFIHVPKSAGTSIEGLLSSYGRVFGVHQPAPMDLPCNVQHFHRPLLEQVYAASDDSASPFDYAFMTVRDPVDRMTSEFFYRLRFMPGVGRSRWHRRRAAVPVSMDEWVGDTLDRAAAEPYLFDNHIRPQHEFRAFGAAVFKLEDGLDPIRQALDDVVGLSGAVPPRQKTSNRQRDVATAPMTASTMHRVIEFYSQDFTQFGYPTR